MTLRESGNPASDFADKNLVQTLPSVVYCSYLMEHYIRTRTVVRKLYDVSEIEPFKYWNYEVQINFQR